MSGPTPIQHKIWRDIDYGYEKLRGSSIEYDENTGDAVWKVHLSKLAPAKQFVHVNARLQRPGWNDGPKSARGIDFSYKQEYTLFSTIGTQKHYIARHSDKGSNHSHHHKVMCQGGHRFCRPFAVFRKDYLPASTITLQVVFYRPELFWNGDPKGKKGKIHQVFPPPTPNPTSLVPTAKPTPAPTTRSPVPVPTLTSAPTVTSAPSVTAAPTSKPTKKSNGKNNRLLERSVAGSEENERHLDIWGSGKAGGSFPPSPSPTPLQPSPSPSVDFFMFNQNATWTLLLETVTVNKRYTEFEITFRYVFLAMTLFIGIRFMLKMSKLSYQMWGYQQKWIMVLLGWLVLFDGPLQAARIYAVDDENLQDQNAPGNENGAQRNVYANRQLSRFLTDFCMFGSTSFVALLMIYFLCILEEMGSGAIWKYFGCHHCQVRAVSNVMKVVLVGSFWATTFACYYLLRREQESDPSFSLFDDDENRFAIATGVIITLYSVYLLWLLALTCDACRALRELTTPFRFVALITMAQAIVVIVGPFVGAWYTIPKSSAAFAVFFGSINLYVYTLAFSYMPMLDGLALNSNDDDDDQDGMLEMTSGFGKDGAYSSEGDMTHELEDGDDVDEYE